METQRDTQPCSSPSSKSRVPRILVWVCRFDEHERFWPHFTEWYAAQKNKYGNSIHFDHIYRSPLHKAQATGVAKAKEFGFSHILLIEDDHWGFPVDGLEVLLESKKRLIGLHTYARGRPEFSIALKKRDPTLSMLDPELLLRPVEYVPGDPVIQEVDVIGYGFTLIEVALFDELLRDPFNVWGIKGTDMQLCHATEEIGVRPCTHFGYTLPHGDVPPELRMEYGRLYQTQKLLEKRFDGYKPGTENRSISAIAERRAERYARTKASDGAGIGSEQQNQKTRWRISSA